MGESVQEVTVGRWLKKIGDTVAVGDSIVALETDKVDVEIPADNDGFLQSIAHAEGDTVAVGDILAVIGDGASGTNGSAPQPVTPSPSDAPRAASQTMPAGNSTAPDASPLARRLAEENGVNLASVKGSGAGGKITKEDVTQVLSVTEPTPPVAAPPKPAAEAPTPPKPAAPPVMAAVEPTGQPEERVKMTRRRQTIAARLVEAQRTAAMLTTFNEVDMTAVMAIRARRKDSFKEKNGVGLGFMSFFTKAVIGALKAFPYLNAEIQGTEIVVKRYYDIGIAVGAEEGLVVPVLRDADKKTFAEIERGIGDLAGKARSNTLSLAELQGGTFTITNGGVFGSLLSTPILNIPQVGILGMHKIEDRAVVVNKEIVVRPMMYLALSYDHRIVDGSEAVRFLVRVKELLEDPETLLLEG